MEIQYYSTTKGLRLNVNSDNSDSNLNIFECVVRWLQLRMTDLSTNVSVIPDATIRVWHTKNKQNQFCLPPICVCFTCTYLYIWRAFVHRSKVAFRKVGIWLRALCDVCQGVGIGMPDTDHLHLVIREDECKHLIY